MKHLPTPDVSRALADIEAVKHGAEPAVVECLAAIADLIEETGDPAGVFDSVLDAFAREELRVLAAAHRVRLHMTSARPVSLGYRNDTFLVWQADGTGIAAVPREQRPRDALAQLRGFVQAREEEQRLADAFQASVTAGYVEGLDAWHVRTSTQAVR